MQLSCGGRSRSRVLSDIEGAAPVLLFVRDPVSPAIQPDALRLRRLVKRRMVGVNRGRTPVLMCRYPEVYPTCQQLINTAACDR